MRSARRTRSRPRDRPPGNGRRAAHRSVRRPFRGTIRLRGRIVIGFRENSVERRDEQLRVFIREHQRRPDLEYVVVHAGEPDEDSVLAQLVADALGKLAARELDACEKAAASHLDDVRLAQARDRTCAGARRRRRRARAAARPRARRARPARRSRRPGCRRTSRTSVPRTGSRSASSRRVTTAATG